jgi:hypothetical protein
LGRLRIRAFAALVCGALAVSPVLHGCGDDDEGGTPGKSGNGGQKDAAAGTSGGGDGSLDTGAAGSPPDSGAGGSSGTGDAGDATSDGPGDATSDAPSDPNKIVVTSRNIFVTDSGEVEVPFDLSDIDAAALVLEGDGGDPATFKVYAPTFPAVGTLEIAGVPQGTFYLRLNRAGGIPAYLVTSERSIDVGSANHGRSDATHAAAGTTLVLNASGLNPWQGSDDISLYSYNLGTALYALHEAASAGAPAAGNTTLSGLTVDYTARATPPRLIDGTKGDRAIAVQRVTRTLAASDTYTAAAKVFELPVFSLTDGQSSTVSGAFTDVPQTSSISLDWKLPEFASLRAAHPSATGGTAYFSLKVTRAPQYGPFDSQPLVVEYISSATTSVAASFNYGNPFGAGYSTVAAAEQHFVKTYALPSASPISMLVRVLSMVPASSSVTMRPLVGPIGNLRINGQDAQANLSGVGRNPTLSWTAPGVGTAHFYGVRFVRLFNDAGTTRQTTTGFVLTMSTSFVIPPNLLLTGNSYVIEITAHHIPGINTATRPYRLAYPYGHATFMSAIISP